MASLNSRYMGGYACVHCVIHLYDNLCTDIYLHITIIMYSCIALMIFFPVLDPQVC